MSETGDSSVVGTEEDAGESDDTIPVLGSDDTLFEINDKEIFARLSLAMASQCTRHLDIVSRHLDPQIYDTDEFGAAIKRLALENRRARIRLLVVDARPLITSGHRLIELASRLPSYIEIRAPGRTHRGFNEALMLADKDGYIYRQFSDRFEAQVNFADRQVVKVWHDRFEDMWERGTPETRFRRLHI